jgi:DNA replication protein DnaC
LTQKYNQAEGEKRDMHNQMVDMQGRIRVYCRVRPLSQKEVLRNETEALKVVDDYTVEVNAGDAPSKVESYDAVFGPNSTQNQVFDNVKRLVKSAVDGYNVCIFAYGSTGSGKTHTIQGTQSDPGICPKALTELFQIIDVANEKGDCEFTVQ